MIARQFTLGQLALIAWALEERSRSQAEHSEGIGRDVDLRRLTGTELTHHLAQLGA